MTHVEEATAKPQDAVPKSGRSDGVGGQWPPAVDRDRDGAQRTGKASRGGGVDRRRAYLDRLPTDLPPYSTPALHDTISGTVTDRRVEVLRPHTPDAALRR